MKRHLTWGKGDLEDLEQLSGKGFLGKVPPELTPKARVERKSTGIYSQGLWMFTHVLVYGCSLQCSLQKPKVEISFIAINRL